MTNICRKAVCVNINQRLKSKYRNTAQVDLKGGGGIVELENWRIGGMEIEGKGLEETVGGRLGKGWRNVNGVEV